MINQQYQSFTVFFEPLSEGGYNVIVPAIPEICTFGETLEEAKKNAQEAISLVLESTAKNNETLPTEATAIKLIQKTVKVAMPAL